MHVDVWMAPAAPWTAVCEWRNLHLLRSGGCGCGCGKRQRQPLGLVEDAMDPSLPQPIPVTLQAHHIPLLHAPHSNGRLWQWRRRDGGGIGRAGGSTLRQHCCLHLLLCPLAIPLSVSLRYPGVLSGLTATPATAMAVPTVEQAVAAASRAYPLPAGFRPAYGTAGFRAVADLLHSTMFRCDGGSARSHLGMRGGGPTTRRPHPSPSPGASPAAGAAS